MLCVVLRKTKSGCPGFGKQEKGKPQKIKVTETGAGPVDAVFKALRKISKFKES